MHNSFVPYPGRTASVLPTLKNFAVIMKQRIAENYFYYYKIPEM